MSLTLSGVPTHADQLRSLQQELYKKNQQLNDKDRELLELRQSLEQAEMERDNAIVAMGALRTVLLPLFNGLKAVFGEMDTAGVTGAEVPSPAGASPRVSQVWESWKAKLPKGEAAAIDALLLHGSLTTAQLRIHIGCASRTAQNIVQALKSKGLVQKDGNGKVSLKEL